MERLQLAWSLRTLLCRNIFMLLIVNGDDRTLIEMKTENVNICIFNSIFLLLGVINLLRSWIMIFIGLVIDNDKNIIKSRRKSFTIFVMMPFQSNVILPLSLSLVYTVDWWKPTVYLEVGSINSASVLPSSRAEPRCYWTHALGRVWAEVGFGPRSGRGCETGLCWGRVRPPCFTMTISFTMTTLLVIVNQGNLARGPKYWSIDTHWAHLYFYSFSIR